MEVIVRFLKENPVQFLATIGLDGKPKVRPFHFMMEDDGKFWFCTSNRKDVYAELKNEPYVELSVASPEHTWLRLAGKVVFENNMTVKNRIMEENEVVRSIYRMADNPVFEVFYLAEAIASVSNLTGSPAKKYHLV